MQSDQHPAFDLIEEAKFARRMLAITDASLVKIIEAAEPKPDAAPVEATRPARLEVPTVNPEGWTDEVRALVRSERALGRTAQEVAVALSIVFGLAVTPQVLLAAIMHFDLDCRYDAPAPEELAVLAVQAEQVAPVQEVLEQPSEPEPVADQPRDATPVVDHEAAPVEDKPAELEADVPAWPNPEDPAINEPWAQRALAMHAEGLPPFRIAGDLKWHGATDFKVRCLLIPGFRQQQRDKINAARGYIAKPRTSAPAAVPPKPAPREPKTKPTRVTVTTPAAQPKPERKAAAEKLDPLPWAIPAPGTAAGCNTEIPVPGKGLHISDLQDRHCRWLMGPGADGHETYCGCQKSKHGSSYCEAHAVKAFNEWPPRTPIKRPTRMARSMSALPDARTRQTERTV
ncbi:GcrA family cell cycle regulator [Ancylobacter sp.]|uniref:GcrA family cell cycle regulator n=1 Tax=Ancylobacter sp. TaxID=1872567 RepID=UPI003D0BB659